MFKSIHWQRGRIVQEVKRILFVEDEPDIQTIVQIALESIGGFSVEACDSGAQAINKAADFSPDFILLDVMMPDMDGPETLKALRELPATASTPVIFMTAKAQPHEIQRFRSLGALDVITKPFDPMTLSDRVAAILSAAHD